MLVFPYNRSLCAAHHATTPALPHLVQGGQGAEADLGLKRVAPAQVEEVAQLVHARQLLRGGQRFAVCVQHKVANLRRGRRHRRGCSVRASRSLWHVPGRPGWQAPPWGGGEPRTIVICCATGRLGVTPLPTARKAGTTSSSHCRTLK